MDNNEKIIERKQDIRVYKDYVDLGKSNTWDYLMLGELIDNAISSFDNHFGGTNWNGEKLRIKITINNNENEKLTESGINYLPKSSIIIQDNAFGINKNKLFDAITLNKKNESISSMNKHGRGLKQSAFFFGLGLKITTKEKNDSETTYSITNSPIDKGFYEEVYFEINEDEWFTEHGTKIEIFNIRSNRVLKNTKLDKIIEILEYRYGKLIKNNQLTISFEINEIKGNKTEEKTKTKNLKNVPDDVAMVSDDFGQNIEEKNKITNDFKMIMKNKISNSNAKDSYSEYESLTIETVNKLSSLILSINNDTKFEWEQEIDLFNETKVKMRFWLISKKKSNTKKGGGRSGYSHLKGIRVYEESRAILHPPIDGKNGVTTYLDPLPSTSASGSTENRFAGEINLEDIKEKIFSTTDKSRFEFLNQDEKEKFDKQITLIFQIFNELIMKGRKSNVGHFPSNNDTKNINTLITGKFPDDIKKIWFVEDSVDEITGEKNKIKSIFVFNKENYDLTSNINYEDNPQSFFKVIPYFDEKKIETTLFWKHNFWNKLNENKNANLEAIIPFYLLLIRQEVEWHWTIKKMKAKINNRNCIPKEDLQEIINTASPEKIINEISKRIK